MFTGIIAGTGKITAKRKVDGGVMYDFVANFDLTEPEEGESIAVSGVCLTAYDIRGRGFCADVSSETLSRTKFGLLGLGDMVNLERALRLSDRLGGHLVSGHIDCMARVDARRDLDKYSLFSFSLPPQHTRYIIEKGSVTIDGVSLTVNSYGADCFAVSIIPHTLATTTLAHLKIGSKVNAELDMIGKYIEKLLSNRAGTPNGEDINPEFLAQHGFI